MLIMLLLKDGLCHLKRDEGMHISLYSYSINAQKKKCQQLMGVSSFTFAEHSWLAMMI